MKVTKVDKKTIILEPSQLEGKYRCLKCAKVFTFRTDPHDPKEKYTKPYCSFCGSADCIALTPLAKVVNTDHDLPKNYIKAVRFIRNNFKILADFTSTRKGLINLIVRSSLKSDTKDELIDKLDVFMADITDRIEFELNKLLAERMKALGITDDMSLKDLKRLALNEGSVREKED